MSLGFGLGLRPHYYPDILSSKSKVDWYEVITENYMYSQGRPLAILEKIRQDTPIVLHGVSLSIGSTDPLDQLYLQKVSELIQRLAPPLVSDHLCWGGVGGENIHDLLPLPFTQKSLKHVVERVSKTQEILKRQILIENVSSYVTFRESELSEWDFIREVSQQSGCGILLDVNNIYVNSVNHGFNPETYLTSLNPSHIQQFHLAGHTNMGTYLFDTHNDRVTPAVWNLYKRAVELFPTVPTLIEWDSDFPPFETLLSEVRQAREIHQGLQKAHYHTQETAQWT